MEPKDPELLDKIRQQFDSAPYPRIPLEQSPKEDYQSLYIHNLVTPYYLRNQKVISTEGKVILDAGCGSGYKSLVLAEANPGARIVGIDISEESVKLAQQRLEYHGFTNCEFHVLKIEDLPKLGLEFDYVNADEVLYLLPDIVAGLKAMQAVLKPAGIIRSNLHCAFQRADYFRAQKMFELIGLMDESPNEVAIELARETLKSLKDAVLVKQQTQNQRMDSNEGMVANCLLVGDKGFTIPDLFNALRMADLEFISMVNWRYWELTDLFKSMDDLPAFLAIGLAEASTQEKLYLYELLHPINRLLDFWCGHPKVAQPLTEISTWTDTDWHHVQVHLHPQVGQEKAREQLVECLNTHRPFVISQYVQLPALTSINLESIQAASLLPLWDGPQPFSVLVDRWQKIQPFHPLTLEPTTHVIAFKQMKALLIGIEAFLYAFLEHSPEKSQEF
ncbi:MAG: class I SAM-dependent methyltransferase [Oscillatoriales cyanobacterium RM1_1_9]|nr:class I SAM-dependent methyltransferase [Oscillatoriales cyanobacterium SM2_3_0]NJO46906.1 class I SAM-dependent methyltransferase [Oscillatoriales cyanobacterium RM2_1_1]NJO71920.1 class I SAM-dependent methyltransferase [Oscillatoriales cyanobacterium RM1_1_9]